MSNLSTGGIYYNDWHAWQSDDMQRTSVFASADRLYSYYMNNILPKRENKRFKNR